MYILTCIWSDKGLTGTVVNWTPILFSLYICLGNVKEGECRRGFVPWVLQEDRPRQGEQLQHSGSIYCCENSQV